MIILTEALASNCFLQRVLLLAFNQFLFHLSLTRHIHVKPVLPSGQTLYHGPYQALESIPSSQIPSKKHLLGLCSGLRELSWKGKEITLLLGEVAAACAVDLNPQCDRSGFCALQEVVSSTCEKDSSRSKAITRCMDLRNTSHSNRQIPLGAVMVLKTKIPQSPTAAQVTRHPTALTMQPLHRIQSYAYMRFTMHKEHGPTTCSSLLQAILCANLCYCNLASPKSPH